MSMKKIIVPRHTTIVLGEKQSKGYPIELYYSFKGKRFSPSTGFYIVEKALINAFKNRTNKTTLPKDFLDKYGQASKSIFEQQLRIEEKVQLFEEEYFRKPTREELITLLAEEVEAKTKILSSIEAYLQNFYELKVAEIGLDSASNYHSMKFAYNEFVKARNRKYTFRDLNKAFFRDFIYYLLLEKPVREGNRGKPSHLLTDPDNCVFDPNFGMNNTTLIKRLYTFMTFLKWAKGQGVEIDTQAITKDIDTIKEKEGIHDYENYHLAFNADEVKHLYSEEFTEFIYNDVFDEQINGKVEERSVDRNILIRVRDYFVVEIMLGTRFSDTIKISKMHLVAGRKVAKKTKAEFQLSDSKVAAEILERYSFSLDMNNARFNKLIKVVTKQFYEYYCRLPGNDGVELDKWITHYRGKYVSYQCVKKWELVCSHTGRRTFATIAYVEKEMDKRQIMKITGHKSENAFFKYIQVDHEEAAQKTGKAMDSIFS